MAMNRKQKRFADFVAMGFTQTEAYRRAYKGVTDDSARVLASDLIRNPEVQERIASYEARFKAKWEAAAEYAASHSLKWLKENARDRASIARLAADIAGRNKKQIEVTGADGGPLELRSLSDEDLAKLQAELDALKKKAG